jgi:hypothetical protein
VNQSVAKGKFIEHAQQVLRRIDMYATSGATDVPARDLFLVKQRLRSMVASVESGTLPPVESRYAELSRLIVDHWPLGHSLGNSVCNGGARVYVALVGTRLRAARFGLKP